MKKTLMLSTFVFFSVAFNLELKAQQAYKPSTLSLQPLWGPAGFNTANYYYMPDMEIYYDVTAKQFIFPEEGEWAFSPKLPEKFKDVDLFSTYKVVINLPHPYLNYDAHKVRYARFKGQVDKQACIKDSDKAKYSYVPGHKYVVETILKSSQAKTPQ